MSHVVLGAPDPGFLADVRSALRVLIDRPLLPLITVFLWGVPVLFPPALGFLAFGIQIFALGYPCTERLWLLRGMRGESFTLEQAFQRNWSYFGRIIRLGLLLGGPAAALIVAALLIFRDVLAFLVALALVGLVGDFALTFVMPALAFTTRSVRDALALGVRMIRSEWPKAALYVLIPPFAILLIAQLVPTVATFRHVRDSFDAIKAGRRPPSISESIRVVSAGLSTLAALIGLLFKGATAAFYARRLDVPEFGASTGSEDRPRIPPRPDTAG